METISSKDIEEQLLIVVRNFLSEFKSDRALSALSLDASLERDLGIDSLGRVELFLRVEKAFSIYLPDTVMAESETLKDIAKAIEVAEPADRAIKKEKEFAGVLKETIKDPSSCRTLVEVLYSRVNQDPERPHIYLQNEDGSETIIQYGQLLERAGRVASGLYDLGIRRGHTVAIMLPTGEEFFYALFGVLIAGGIPVPIYPPLRADKIEEYAIREAGILNNAEVRVLITFSKAESLGKLLSVFIKSLQHVTNVSTLMRSTSKVPLVPLRPEDPALIQYTSGSTSAPKGVLLSHFNLLSNIRSAGKATNLTSKDAAVSWLPLYHDMGLIGSWFCSLYYALPVTIMSPIAFLNRPERWLWAIHYHRGTVSAGPNFAYELCVRKIDESAIQGLDLSSWRLAFNGAEPINPKTMERFIEKFKPYGFKPESMYPVYGLAENSVALAFSPMGRPPKIDTILREPFETEKRAISAEGNSQNNMLHRNSTLQFVSCGFPIPDHDIRIVDEQKRELPERHVGIIQFSGPSAMIGYYQNKEATQAVYFDGWWDTGDYGYIADGEIYITGREKDLIIKAGRNLYPQEIEEASFQVTGIRKGCVIAFGVEDPNWGTEKLVIVAETNETKKATRDQIKDEVIEKVSLVVGVPPDEVILVPARTIPKTSSGKLQRSACKKMYQSGQLTKKGLPVWAQMSKLFIKGLFLKLGQRLKKLGQFLYTAYIGLIVILLTPFILLSVLISSKNFLRTMMKVWAKILLTLGFCRVHLEGRENLSKTSPILFVSNHASYVDSIVLVSVLPTNLLVVSKAEVFHWPVLGWMAKKLGYLPVDRMDFSKSLAETKNIIEAIEGHNSILIYPEGTFSYAAGLRPFKLGAFKISVDTSTPICPIAIQGTRHLLRGDSLLLNPVKVSVWAGEPIQPQGKDWQEVTRLHSVVRSEIAQHCGELSIDLVAAMPVIPNNNDDDSFHT